MEIESPGYRLIFIDVDGVLNRWTERRDEPFAYALMERLAALVRAVPQAALVLSTAWRLSKATRAAVKQALLQHGLPLPLSCTPRMKGPRGYEVLAWLQANTLNVLQDVRVPYRHDAQDLPGEFEEHNYRLPVRIKVAQYVALDDRDFRTAPHGGRHRALLVERGHYVWIDPHEGLSAHNVEEARALLLAPDMDLRPTTAELMPAEEMRHLGDEVVKSTVELRRLTPHYCAYCERQVTGRFGGVRDEASGKHFCKLECLYRYRKSQL